MATFGRNTRARGNECGFTLIEMMITWVTIYSIASIHIPDLTRSRMSANEAGAIGAMRTLSSAQSLFRESDGDGDGIVDYATSLAGLLRAGLIDDALASGASNGYCLILVSNNADTWHAHANPAIPDTTGERWFFVDETPDIRFSTMGLATAASEIWPGGGGEPGVVDESQSEHTISGCGEAEGPPTDLLEFAEQALDELARFLPAGTSKDDALSLLNDPKFVTAVGAHLDANADQSLSLSEMLQVDVLTAARGVATELFPNDPRQEVELGKDERVRTWTTWYQKKVGERLQLGAANEEGDPTIPLP